MGAGSLDPSQGLVRGCLGFWMAFLLIDKKSSPKESCLWDARGHRVEKNGGGTFIPGGLCSR